MNNESIYKQVPETLADCTKDETAGLVLKWADRIHSWGCFLCFLLIFIGFCIGGTESSALSKYSEDDATLVFLTAIVPWCIYGILSYLVCRIASVLIEALANITLNTAVTANIAMYEARQKYVYTESPAAYDPEEEYSE